MIIDKSPRTRPALIVIALPVSLSNIAVEKAGLKVTLEKINELIGIFHSYNLPVIHAITAETVESVTDHPAGESQPVSPEEEPRTVHHSKDDITIIKTHPDAFTGTSLEKILWERNVNTIVLSGFSIYAGIALTAIAAYERDFMPVLAGEAILELQPERETPMLAVLATDYAISPVSNLRIKELIESWVNG